jgi:hypothetical protein
MWGKGELDGKTLTRCRADCHISDVRKSFEKLCRASAMKNGWFSRGGQGGQGGHFNLLAVSGQNGQNFR